MSSADPALVRPKWSERVFRFGHPPWMAADFAERLRGTPERIAPLLAGLDERALREKVDGAWSILQNAGHLGDVEELWLARVEDLRAGRATFAPADPEHFRKLAEAHQARSPAEVVRYVRERREPFLAELARPDEHLQRAQAHHARLGVPMRLVDLAQFSAEHDDHHLLRIRELRRRLGA